MQSPRELLLLLRARSPAETTTKRLRTCRAEHLVHLEQSAARTSRCRHRRSRGVGRANLRKAPTCTEGEMGWESGDPGALNGDNYAKSVNARVLRGRRSAQGPRATGFERGDHNVLKPQLSTCRGVGEEKPRPTGWGGARSAFAAKTTTLSPPERGCSVGSRSVLHGAKRAGGARHGIWKLWPRGFEAAAADLARCRCGRASAKGVGWSAPRVGRGDNYAKFVSARVLRGRSAGFPRSESRAGRAARASKAVDTTLRNRSRRIGAVSVKKSIGQRRGVERALRWP